MEKLVWGLGAMLCCVTAGCREVQAPAPDEAPEGAWVLEAVQAPGGESLLEAVPPCARDNQLQLHEAGGLLIDDRESTCGAETHLDSARLGSVLLLCRPASGTWRREGNHLRLAQASGPPAVYVIESIYKGRMQLQALPYGQRAREAAAQPRLLRLRRP